MPEVRQKLVEAYAPSGKTKGSRYQNSLSSCFPASPIYLGSITDQERKEYFRDNSLNGVSSGHGIENFDRDYTEAPNFGDVDTDGLNIPSPFMPNPTSPGPGSVNAAEKPKFTGNVPDPELNIEFGSGLGGTLSPSDAASQISAQDTLSIYIKGKSYEGSDGSV